MVCSRALRRGGLDLTSKKSKETRKKLLLGTRGQGDALGVEVDRAAVSTRKKRGPLTS